MKLGCFPSEGRARDGHYLESFKLSRPDPVKGYAGARQRTGALVVHAHVMPVSPPTLNGRFSPVFTLLG
jgi:hypothetical protein